MVSMLSTGAAGLVMEYVLATVSTYVLGNSIEQFSIVIAVMMLTMGGATFLQKYVGDDYLIEKFVAVEVLLSVLGGFAPILIYAAFASFETHFSVVLMGLAACIGFLIGLEIPLVLRINARYVGELRANLGWVLSMDFVGAFFGAIVWVKWLLGSYPLTEISFIVAGVNFLVATMTFVYFAHRGGVAFPKLCFAASLAAAAALSWGWLHNRDWSASIEQQLYEAPIKHAETSKFQRIVLTHDTQSGDWRLYLNGGLQFSSGDEAVYHEHLVHPVMAIAPRREKVLILGGGDGLALREVLKYRDVRKVALVDIDPAIVRLASTSDALRTLNGEAFADARVSAMGSPAVTGSGFRQVVVDQGNAGSADPKRKTRRGVDKIKVATVEVIHIDAFKFVTSIGQDQWDVIIIDFPDPDQVEIAKLYSRDFYRMLKHVIAPHGLVAVQATSPYHAKEAFLCIGRTIESAGYGAVPYHANVPSFGDWGWYIFSPEMKTNELRARLASIGDIPVATRYLTPELLSASLAFGKRALTARFDDVSTVMEPRILQLYVQYAWQRE